MKMVSASRTHPHQNCSGISIPPGGQHHVCLVVLRSGSSPLRQYAVIYIDICAVHKSILWKPLPLTVIILQENLILSIVIVKDFGIHSSCKTTGGSADTSMSVCKPTMSIRSVMLRKATKRFPSNWYTREENVTPKCPV